MGPDTGSTQCGCNQLLVPCAALCVTSKQYDVCAVQSWLNQTYKGGGGCQWGQWCGVDCVLEVPSTQMQPPERRQD